MNPRHFLRSLAALQLATWAALSACTPRNVPSTVARAAPAPAPEATATPAPHEEEEIPPPRTPNVAELEEKLRASHGAVKIWATPEGHVQRIEFVARRGTYSTPTALFNSTLLEVGGLLGYGTLGYPTFEGGSGISDAALGSLVGQYGAASGCPGLRFEAAFERHKLPDAEVEIPRVWTFACPSSAPAMDAFRKNHESLAALANPVSPVEPADPSPDDPVAPVLRSEALVVHRVERDARGQRYFLRGVNAIRDERYTVAKSLAEKVARAASLPPLDTLELDPTTTAGKAPTDPKSLRSTFRTLSLRAKLPPLDHPCIDPRVEITFGDLERSRFAAAPSGGTAIRSVTVECEREPSEAAVPPQDPSLPVPRAASGALPFLAMCEMFNFAAGGATPHSGYVIDKRGHVFEFLSGKPAISGRSVHELAVLVRAGKRYMRTLPASEVDRLAALTPQVEAERIVSTTSSVVADAGGFSCYVLRSGGAPDTLVRIALDDSGNEGSRYVERARTGPASSALRKLLERAAGRNQP
ncbi:MAG: hypothetical protein JST00_32835 [Deltaproteobacteria bacterium]|nr:hypothetical protein [Deltaproteobacteria bacterium]